ncbi:MAG: two-component system, sensor histidine kinase and response regulator [Acidimicrobiaceae bacterium]|jgi:PAS domain S-box-containing protein
MATGRDALRRMNTATTEAPVPILIVDDNAAKRLAVKAVLSPLGFPIVEADSGVAALRCVMNQDFAVILLDVCMPLMDGFETAALIRQRRQSEMTPIIFFTAYGSDDIADADRYAEGAVDFMFAPVPPNELRAKVSVFANLFIKAEALATQALAVQTSADQLRLLTDAAPIGIFQTDAENRYVYTNPRWSEITGVSPEAATGQPWGSIIAFEDRGGVGPDLAQDAANRSELCHRFELKIPGSASRIVLLTAKPIPDNDGGFAGWVGTLADVTAETGAEAAMSAARDEATEASRLKSDFLANMSHEIRTPMNGVIGMTDLLLETELDDVQRDYAQTVRNSGEALMTIINDILDFSKVEAGMLEVEDIQFSVRGIVDDVVTLLTGPAQTKGLELFSVIEHTVPAVISGDPGRVRQVLTNLIGNAIKFTKTGEIAVRVAAVEIDDDSVVRFEVRDTGVGIAADKLDLIFQPFVQADTSTSRKYGGTGLGLAISGQLVALMGGECGVSSEVEQGSKFWFTIRVHAHADHLSVDAAPAALIPRPASPSEGEGVRLLLAEDNLINQKVAVAMLASAGYQVDTVPDGAAAVHAAAECVYDAILMDCHMPDVNGYEATAAIRAQEGPSRHTPIIAMTAGARREDRERCLAEGMDGYLAKPVSKDALLALVARSLNNEPAEELTVDPLILEQLHLLGDAAEQDFVGELIDQFVLDTEPLLVRLRDAFDTGDGPAVAGIAHNIKGSSGQLGGRRLASSCARLVTRAATDRLFDDESDLQDVEADFQALCEALTEHVSSWDRQRAS